jgi:hypothetical protein
MHYEAPRDTGTEMPFLDDVDSPEVLLEWQHPGPPNGFQLVEAPWGRAMHKLIRRYEVTDAAVHDSQKLDGLLTKGNTSADVFGDSAYRSTEIEGRLRAGGLAVVAVGRTYLFPPLSSGGALVVQP